MSSFVILAKHFDVQKLQKACNARGCDTLPTKEIMLYELELKSLRQRTLASIFLCPDHNRALIPNVMDELRTQLREGWTLEKKDYDLVYR